MTAPDPGLTDLIAAHREGDYGRFGRQTCKCGWTGDSHPAHVALVVEQHTNGRIAELEATVARVEDAVSGLPACDKYGPDDVVSCGWKRSVADVRAALEGAPDADSTREP